MCEIEKTTGLRIDVDTLRGTRQGVPALLEDLARFGIKATFFFSVGPDNMGRHLRRLIRPAFFLKMIRSNGASLYGWDILFRGTFGPGPIIGYRCGDIIRKTAEAGHETGLHAWDHHLWQNKIETLDIGRIYTELTKGKELLEQLTSQPVYCSAAPGWRATDKSLLEKELLKFHYNADCRGTSLFFPKVNGKTLTQPQVPTTLPTYDEVIGRKGITMTTYNDHLLSLIKPDRLNVLTIHAEVEGLYCRQLFREFLAMAQEKNIRFVPLKTILKTDKPLSVSPVTRKKTTGRDGWISQQYQNYQTGTANDT
ncbi:putative 4-deoxy-4-formamido-L-arabinose-phosphoundecaprenol deformylase ArnD [Desulfomarina profundi]|uniref:4-deoxy-4-formamido-L-arabinose-phosphoundecaprenol deformylase ArnD n=1 Tax=Desulfomarina profundi TaxID=2772557 RepID=A0A8D5FJ30_9BACT|nr:polysaccharide deacetylase family protein [Desulfomarina profundi]BCL61705.1 putative 4-deoxy-4-formamido-L-arabinose-phosphoundecaprenol deformylase ArnD [Desulfomarina profundi]